MKDEAYLRHILDAISDVENFTSRTTEKAFFRNKKTQYAVVRAIEIIGEATKNISADLKTKNPQVPWKDIAGMRDKVIHGYFGVNYEVVWDATRKNLPDLKREVLKILEEVQK